MKTTTKSMTFEEWKAKVNSYIEAWTGLTCDDMPDYCYADAYADGQSARQTASAVIRDSDY